MNVNSLQITIDNYDNAAMVDAWLAERAYGFTSITNQGGQPPTNTESRTMTFTAENTTGYTDTELDTLNAEWAAIVKAERLSPESDEYYQREKQFQDDVSKR